jgi:glutamyl/glutaminyl-tRNA synthetase
VLSKRVLTELVRGGHVKGWDDPRMPTLAGLRRRGVPAGAIRDFVKRIGVAKSNSVVDAGMLEFSIREVLNKNAPRRMAVLRPLKVVIENYPKARARKSKPSIILTIRPPGLGRSASGASSTSSETTSWRAPRRSSSGFRREPR